MILVSSEWNIDLASENLGSSSRDTLLSQPTEIAENDFCKYDVELTYMYEPHDTMPSTTCALYGDDKLSAIPDSVLSGTEVVLPGQDVLTGQDVLNGPVDLAVSDVTEEVQETVLQAGDLDSTTHPEVLPTNCTNDDEHDENDDQDDINTWTHSSPSHESLDSSWESQVSTPHASPRRSDEESKDAICEYKIFQRGKADKADKANASPKTRKRELENSRSNTESRTKQARVSKASVSAREGREYSSVSTSSSSSTSLSSLLAATAPRAKGRTRSVTPLPEDDPQGLFSRDPSTLTPEEVRMLKKKKRLIKNRESAQLSRQRKRIRLETLQTEVLALEGENRALHAKVAQLMEDNAALRRKLGGASATAGASVAKATRGITASAVAATAVAH